MVLFFQQSAERSTKILDGSAATTADLSEIEQIVKERMVNLCVIYTIPIAYIV